MKIEHTYKIYIEDMCFLYKKYINDTCIELHMYTCKIYY